MGIYFGSVFLNEIRTLEWGVIYKPKNHVDINRPVITGFKKIELNPISVVNNISLTIVEETATENQLFELYNIWKEYL
ncbi:hypothetical protein D3C75_998570 [compost metagenome]